MATRPQPRRRFAPLLGRGTVNRDVRATQVESHNLDLFPAPPEQSVRSAFEREVARSRRYDRPFSILVVLDDVGRRQSLRAVATLIADEIRLLDTLFLHQNRLIVICPETDDHGVGVLATRLRLAAMERGVQLGLGVASFPAGGTTLDDLVRLAQVGGTGGFAGASLPYQGLR